MPPGPFSGKKEELWWGLRGRVQGRGRAVQQGLKGTHTPSSPAPGLGVAGLQFLTVHAVPSTP